MPFQMKSGHDLVDMALSQFPEAQKAKRSKLLRDTPEHEYYTQNIEPLTDRFEGQRLDAVNHFRKWRNIFVVFGIILAVPAYFIIQPFAEDFFATGFLMLFGGFFYFALAAGVSLWKFNSLLSDVKTTIFPLAVEYFGDDYYYRPAPPWDMSRLKPSGIVPSFDKASMEDYVVGSYKEVGVEVVEADLVSESTDSKGRTTTTTVFHGLFVLLSPKRTLPLRLRIRKAAGTVSKFFRDTFSDLQRIKLEDPVFERQFDVYGDDQISARAFLTVGFMQRLLDLGQSLGSDNFECAVFDGKLLIKLPVTGDFFEPQARFEPIDFSSDFATMIDEMKIIFQIIDVLKLDQDIGL